MKKLFLLLVLCVMPFSLFAIPGVVDIIPTNSGQYVYYRDYGFTWETYIGFIQYDEATYGVRYYAPNPDLGSQDIEILLTIDPTQDYVLMTGEKIVSDVTMDDNTMINYLHDMFYELAPRRKNVVLDYVAPELDTELATTKQFVHDDFFQYGGSVLMEYDLHIPIFNLRSIKSGNEIVLEAVTMGQLTETGDPAFSNFKGFPTLPSKEPNSELVIKDLENQWLDEGGGFYFIGSESMLFSYDAEFPVNFVDSYNVSVYDFIAKDFSLSGLDSYVYLPEQKVELVNDSLVVTNSIYMPVMNQFTKDIKILKSYEESATELQLYNITLFSSFHEIYYSNEAEFNDFLDSFYK